MAGASVACVSNPPGGHHAHHPFEIDIAVADFACAETVGYTNGALAVQVAMENRFIDDNREELDELLAEIAQGG